MRHSVLKLALVLGVVAATASAPSVARLAASTAAPALQSIGPLAFGPDGVLFAADRQAATIIALEIGRPAGTPGTMNVPAVDQKIAALLGTEAGAIQVTDLAVHPDTKHTYLSVMRGQGPAAQPALVRIDGSGRIDVVALESLKATSVSLPNPGNAGTGRANARMQSVTDMAFLDGKLYVTGLSNEEFASKFWTVPYPFETADRGTSVEIYHGNHGAFETRSPVMAFVPTRVGSEPTMLAGYTCTPLVTFALKDLKPGAKVMGTTIAELGAGNQPLDMVLYRKGGQEYLLMSNSRHGVLKIATSTFAGASPITTRISGTAGVPAQRVEAMVNVRQLDLLNATHSIVLVQGEGGALNLEAVILP